MAHRDDIAALEALTPWTQPQFRAGLAALSTSTAAAARAFAADARVLTALAGQVPRCAGDDTGGTPWTSFRREVAVARSVSDQAAAAEIRTALRLTSTLPHTLDLLDTGQITVSRARVLVDELEVFDDELASQLDADLADRIAHLAPWRIKHEVRRAALVLDPDSAALRTAAKTAARGTALQPLADGQASVVLTGPATPLTRWHTTLDERARALRAAGDNRTLDALRFDLATSTYPCTTHTPADPTTPPIGDAGGNGPGTTDAGAASAAAAEAGAPAAAPALPGTSTATQSTTPEGTSADVAMAEAASAGLRLSGVEAASSDCRRSRPVQAVIVVPVETALGLSNEPAWLDGYGWLDAPTSRTLLLDAELRQLCTDRTTGQPLNLDPHDRRPPPTPDGLRTALLELTTDPIPITDISWRTEPQHDPSPALRQLTTLRDRTCDGPTQTSTPATHCDQDHDQPHPAGPTAAWNLASRSRRTHQLKHYGWTPLRTPTSTLWTSPAGQIIDVPHHHKPAPGPDPDPTGQPTALPDPQQLADTDRYQLTPPTPDDTPPRPPNTERTHPTHWTLLNGSDAPPF